MPPVDLVGPRGIRFRTAGDGQTIGEMGRLSLDSATNPADGRDASTEVHARRVGVHRRQPRADQHPAAEIGLMVVLDGTLDVECGNGTWRIGRGDFVLAEDVDGDGHIARAINGPIQYVWISLDTSLAFEAEH